MPGFGFSRGFGARGRRRPSGGTPTPSMPAIANLVMHYRVEDIPVQADNTAFAGEWTDSISGAKISQATALNRPLYRTSRINGLPALQVTGTQWLTVGRPAAMLAAMANSTLAAGATMFMVVSIDATKSGAFRRVWAASDVSDKGLITASSSEVGTFGTTRAFTGRGGFAILVARRSSALGLPHFLDQFTAMSLTSSDILKPHATNNYCYGHSGNGDSSHGFCGDLLDFGFYNRCLSLVEIAQIIKALCYKFGQPAPWEAKPYFTIFDGDSYTAGNGGSWADKLTTAKSVPLGCWSNIAISGQQASKMATNVALNYPGLAAELGRPVALLAQEYYNQPDADAVNFRSFLGAVRTAAPEIRIAAMDAWDNGRPSGVNSNFNRAPYNAALAADTAKYDVLIPISTNATVGVEGACPEEPGPYGPNFQDSVGHPTVAHANITSAFAGPYYDTLVAGL